MRSIVCAIAVLGLSGACDAASCGEASSAAAGSELEAAEGKASASAHEAAEAHPGPPPADASKTASGLVTKVLQGGRGDSTPEAHDRVRVHYTGWNEKGKKFEDTRAEGQPATLELDAVIAGLTEGLQLMKVGERRRLWVPDELAYPGRPGSPRGNLVFDVELLEIIDGPAPLPAPPDLTAPPADATRTESGLVYRWLERGEGDERPRAWDRVKIHYAGWAVDGEMFDSSQKLDGPATFDVGDVIPGWTEGLQRMTTGDRLRLWVPEALAYGGRPGRPKGPLVFDLELVSIERRPEPPRAPRHVAAPPKDAQRTPSGLAYRVLEKGKGERRPEATSRVKIHYSGWTAEGKLFDSSVVRGHPATVPLNRVIAGWTEGLQLMAEGDEYLFWVPEKLAYQDEPGSPQGMLVYEIELLEILPRRGAHSQQGSLESPKQR